LPVIALNNLLQAAVLLTATAHFLLSLRGFFSIRKPAVDGTWRRFALILPAHNEETVIKFSIESLFKMDYPADKFDIYIIADHCTDKTVEIAGASGVSILEHTGPDKKTGKGRALKWACPRILALNKHDALCYFDADSLAHPGFLSAINAQLAAGAEVVQGRLVTKNPENWLTRIIASELIMYNRFYERPKYALGLSAKLFGKGLCLSKKISANHEWDETSLTEDLELQMRLIRHGVHIAWAENAIIYDEEPATLRQYLQRTIRWKCGAFDTSRRHLAGLWRRAILSRDASALEGAIYCARNYLLPVVLLTIALTAYFRESFNFYIWLYRQGEHLKPAILLPAAALLAAYPAVAMRQERAPLGIVAAFFLQPALLLLRIPIFVAGVFRTRDEWERTEHTSKVTISDLVKASPETSVEPAQADN